MNRNFTIIASLCGRRGQSEFEGKTVREIKMKLNRMTQTWICQSHKQ